jgi:hypothetical protein
MCHSRAWYSCQNFLNKDPHLLNKLMVHGHTLTKLDCRHHEIGRSNEISFCQLLNRLHRLNSVFTVFVHDYRTGLFNIRGRSVWLYIALARFVLCFKTKPLIYIWSYTGLFDISQRNTLSNVVSYRIFPIFHAETSYLAWFPAKYVWYFTTKCLIYAWFHKGWSYHWSPFIKIVFTIYLLLGI